MGASLWDVILWLHLQKRFKTQLSEGDKPLEPRMNPRRTWSDQIPAGQNTEKLFWFDDKVIKRRLL